MLTAAVAALAAVVAPVTAVAEEQPVLVSSSPAASTSVAEPPEVVELVFVSALRSDSVEVVLLDADRRGTVVPAPTLSADGRTVTVRPLPSIADGTWVVTWSVALVDDAGAHEGSFAFQVGEGDERTGPQADRNPDALRTDAGLGRVLGAARILTLLAALLLVGGVLVVRDPMRAASSRTTMSRMVAILVLVVGSAGVLLLRGAHAAGLSWGAIGDIAILRETLTGRFGVSAVACVVLAAGWLFVVGTTPAEPSRRWNVVTRGLAVLTLVAVVAGVPLPGSGDGADGRGSFGASLVAGDTVAELEVLPAAAGTAEVHVYLSPPGGMLAPAESVTMSMASGELDLGAMPVVLVEAGPNHWSGVVLIPYAGDWDLEFVSTAADGAMSRFAATVPVTG
jgi:methionine-rich copper-binding protein CopC